MQHLESERDFNRLCMNNFGKVIVLVFYAEWYEHSVEYQKNISQLYKISSLDATKINFAYLDAEKVPEVANRYNVNNVPTVIFTDSQKEELKRFENEIPALLFESIDTFMIEYQKKFDEKKVVMYKKIENLINENPVLIFIKGTPQEPECKFTRQFLEIVKDLDCKFTYYDIIADNDMRHWLRHYNQWPTYPQLYVDKELIGGLDKVKQKLEEGYIQQRIPKQARIHDPQARLQKITTENKVILFTQGLAISKNLDEQHKNTIELLKNSGIKFNCFDVTSDEILQKYISEKFGSFPQLFSIGKPLGTLQQLSELQQKQQLLEQIPGSEWQLDGEQKLRYLLKNCPVIIFINGIPKDCLEQSKEMVEILQKLNVVFEFYNVDADNEVLGHLLKISQYDKVPQLYIKGQLIGGIEATLKLFQDGDLQELLQQYVRK